MINIAGPLNNPKTSPEYALGTRAASLANGNEYVYLKGDGDITTYEAATYDGDFKTTVLTAGTYGPVGVSQGSASDGYYNWFLIKGVGSAYVKEIVAGGDQLFTISAGYFTTAKSGSIVIGAFAGTAQASGSIAQVNLCYPSHNYSILA